MSISSFLLKIGWYILTARVIADQAELDFEAKKLQSIVKEKSYIISETGALADLISPGVLKSLVTLNDKPK